jgi:hypothetical protein
MYSQFFKTISVLVIITSLIGLGVDATCSLSSLDNCIAPVVKYSQDRLQITYQPFSTICSQLDNVYKCLNKAGCTNCDGVMVVWWLGKKDGLSYVCGDQSAKDVMTTNQCLYSDSTEQKITGCVTEYTGFFGSNRGATCGGWENYLKCLEDAVKSCGNDVTRVYLTMTYKFAKPDIELYGCDIKSSYVTLSASQNTSSVLLLTAIFVYLYTYY